MIAKTASLTIAIILTYCGIHAEHPFLLHCLEGNSPTLSNIGDNVTLCDLDDDDPTYPSCQTSQDDFDQDQKLKTLLEIVKRMELDKNQFGEESKGLNMSKFVHHLPNLDSLADMKKELDDKIHNLGVSRLVQKVRGILVVYCFTLFFCPLIHFPIYFALFCALALAQNFRKRSTIWASVASCKRCGEFL